jgi:hypothetical protein
VAGSTPLAVTCLSCGSRLKVAEPRWIGSIVPCPKCGGLVEIKLPGFAPAQADVDSSGAGPTGQPTAVPSRAPAFAEQPVPETTISPRRQPAPSAKRLEVGKSESIDSEALTQSSIVPPEELWLPEESSTPPIASHVTGTSDSSQLPTSLTAGPERRGPGDASPWIGQLGSAVMLGVLGLIVASVAFFLFAKAYLGDAAKVVATAELDAAATTQWSTGDEAQVAAVELPVGSPTEVAAGQVAGVPIPPADEKDPPANADAGAGDAASDGTSPTISAPLALPTDTPPAGGVFPSPLPVPGNPSDPQPPTAVSDTANPPGSADNGGTLDSLPPGLRKFIPLLNPSTAEIGPPRVFDTPPTIDSVPLERAAEDQGVDHPPLVKRPVVDIPKAMKLRVAIQQTDVPLAELVLLVSQLTNVPVELELISLDAAGIALTQSCQTPTGWLPIGQWLDQSLLPLGLVAEVDAERLLVRATPQKILAASGSALVLDDFGDQAEAVAAWVRPVVGFVGQASEIAPQANAAVAPPAEGAVTAPDAAPAEPKPLTEDGWKYVAEDFRIEVPEESSALIRAIFAVEAARMARGLPPRLPRWQTVRWVGTWEPTAVGRPGSDDSVIAAVSDWPRVVGPPSGATQDSPRTLAGMLRQLAAENRISIQVAWLDALRHEVEPGVQVMPLMDGLPVGEVLNDLVGESGLQTRDAGGAVWWIGSESNYDRYEVVTWVAIPNGSGAAVAGRLANSLGLSDRSRLPAAWDEALLLVRIPRFVARQLNRVANP